MKYTPANPIEGQLECAGGVRGGSRQAMGILYFRQVGVQTEPLHALSCISFRESLSRRHLTCKLLQAFNRNALVHILQKWKRKKEKESTVTSQSLPSNTRALEGRETLKMRLISPNSSQYQLAVHPLSLLPESGGGGGGGRNT